MQLNRIARISTLATIVASLTLAAPAMAMARPTINLDRADAAEHAAIVSHVEEWNSDVDDQLAILPLLDPEDQLEAQAEILPTIVGWTLDGCDQETIYRAVCDWTLTYSDDSTEDGSDDVIVKRNGRYIVR